MCLRIKKIRHLNHKAKIAKRPIKCYKVLLYGHNKLRTPATSDEVCTPPKELIADSMKTYTFDTIIENGIHTFSNLKTAYEYYNVITFYSYGASIFLAIIPKGTRYWIGKNHEYVSERIEFL